MMNGVWFDEVLCPNRLRNVGRGKARRKPYAWPKERSRTRNNSIVAADFWIGCNMDYDDHFWVSRKPYALMILVSVVKLCCVDDFWVSSDSVFINDFWVSRKPYALTISIVKLYCFNDFWIGSDSVFINNYWVSRKLYALMISASAVKQCCVDDFWVDSDLIFINDF